MSQLHLEARRVSPVLVELGHEGKTETSGSGVCCGSKGVSGAGTEARVCPEIWRVPERDLLGSPSCLQREQPERMEIKKTIIKHQENNVKPQYNVIGQTDLFNIYAPVLYRHLEENVKRCLRFNLVSYLMIASKSRMHFGLKPTV